MAERTYVLYEINIGRYGEIAKFNYSCLMTYKP